MSIAEQQPAVTVESLPQTAACAAVSGRQGTREHVRNAIAAGLQAASHATYLPLPVLLDLDVLLGGDDRLEIPWRRSSCRPAVLYDRVLGRICEQVRRCLADQNAPSAGSVPDYVFLSTLQWCPPQAIRSGSDYRQRCRIWADAYTEWQQNESAVEQILDCWRRPRMNASVLWNEVAPAGKPTSDSEHSRRKVNPDDIWFLFRWYDNSRQVAEKFDHHAGQLYFDADDPEVLPDQTHRIRRLHQRINTYELPVKMTPDEQSLLIGDYPLSLLITEPFEHLACRLINHWDPRLNRPPTCNPPRRVHLHICWTSGMASEATRHGFVKTGASQQRPAGTKPNAPADSGPESESRTSLVRTSYASTVQVLTALIVDDLRTALRGLPVSVHMHRTAAAPIAGFSVNAGEPGTRWKETVFGGGKLPRADVIHLLFRRRLITETEQRSPGFRIPADERGFHRTERHPQHWFLGVVWKGDLVDDDTTGHRAIGHIRFQPLNRIQNSCTVSAWRCRAEDIPEYLTHLLLVDRGNGTGQFFEIRRERRNVRLLPRRQHRSGPSAGLNDPSFVDLRTDILDLVLDALETRMT